MRPVVGSLLLALGVLAAGAEGGGSFRGLDARGLCPADMTAVPGGAFLAGAEPDAIGIPDFVPDIPREPRARQERTTSAFCIDTFEQPGAERRPRADVTWIQARAACQSQGKRLCSEDEWTRACGGPLGWLRPYGDDFVPGLCHGDVQGEGRYDAILPAGGSPGCRSVEGVADLEGSVSEWAEGTIEGPDPDTIMQTDGGGESSWDGPQEFRLVLGGTMWPGVYGSGCQARHGHPGLAPVSGDDGFRCCRDPEG